MVVEPLPSETLAAPTNVIWIVSPAHAAGRLATSTRVTFPELSTLRVAVSDEMPHEETVALPAARLDEASASVAAAAHPANAAATTKAKPMVLVRNLISGFLLRTGAPPQVPPFAFGSAGTEPSGLAVDRDGDAGDRSGVRRRAERADRDCRAGTCRAVDRVPARKRRISGTGEGDRDGLAVAERIHAGDGHAAHLVARDRGVVREGVGAGRGAARLAGRDGGVARAQRVGADVERCREA